LQTRWTRPGRTPPSWDAPTSSNSWLLEREGGAGRQRRFYALAGMGALLRELTGLTAG
jgi:hypothetical protein